VGSFTVRGTVRKVNEDRFDAKLLGEPRAGQPLAFAGVYDGHGGAAVAEWLKERLYSIVDSKWDVVRPQAGVTDAFLAADKELLSTRTGFMGMGALLAWARGAPGDGSRAQGLCCVGRAATARGWSSVSCVWGTAPTGGEWISRCASRQSLPPIEVRQRLCTGGIGSRHAWRQQPPRQQLPHLRPPAALPGGSG
jgi:hypothetical protein